jgi:hypothetical protein
VAASLRIERSVVVFAVARDVEPEAAPCLAVRGRGQEAIDDLRKRLGRIVLDEGVDFFWRRRQPHQVERGAANQGPFVGRTDRRQTFLLETREDESIDVGLGPRRVVHPVRAARSPQAKDRCGSPPSSSHSHGSIRHRTLSSSSFSGRVAMPCGSVSATSGCQTSGLELCGGSIRAVSRRRCRIDHSAFARPSDTLTFFVSRKFLSLTKGRPTIDVTFVTFVRRSTCPITPERAGKVSLSFE